MSIHEGAERDSAASSSTIMDGLLREVTKSGRGDGGGTEEEETRGGGGGGGRGGGGRGGGRGGGGFRL